jgi:hypothetical protein
MIIIYHSIFMVPGNWNGSQKWKLIFGASIDWSTEILFFFFLVITGRKSKNGSKTSDNHEIYLLMLLGLLRIVLGFEKVMDGLELRFLVIQHK